MQHKKRQKKPTGQSDVFLLMRSKRGQGFHQATHGFIAQLQAQSTLIHQGRECSNSQTRDSPNTLPPQNHASVSLISTSHKLEVQKRLANLGLIVVCFSRYRRTHASVHSSSAKSKRLSCHIIYIYTFT